MRSRPVLFSLVVQAAASCQGKFPRSFIRGNLFSRSRSAADRPRLPLLYSLLIPLTSLRAWKLNCVRMISVNQKKEKNAEEDCGNGRAKKQELNRLNERSQRLVMKTRREAPEKGSLLPHIPLCHQPGFNKLISRERRAAPLPRRARGGGSERQQINLIHSVPIIPVVN